MGFICITGMHRSGTSAVARVLNLLGVDLGSETEMMAPAEDNPKGFWEREDLKRVSDAVLKAMGGSWHDIPDLEPGWERAPSLDLLRERAGEIVDGLAQRGSTWFGFKDPRSALLLPFWRTILTIDRTVVALRHPAEVAASLQRRNEISLGRAAELWIAYNAAIHRNADSPVVVRYDELIADPTSVAESLVAELDLPLLSESIRDQIRGFIDPSLRHQRDMSAPRGEPALSLAIHVHELLIAGGGTSELTYLDNVTTSRQTATPGRSTDTPKEIDQQTPHIQQVRDRLEAARTRHQEARDRLATKTDALSHERAETRQLQEQLEAAQTRHQHAQDLLAATRGELAKIRSQLRSARASQQKTSKELAATTEQVRQLERQHRRLMARRSVRAALGIAGSTEPLFRVVRGLRQQQRTHGDERAQAAAAVQRHTVTTQALEACASPVSIIVPIDNAAEPFSRCMAALLRNTSGPAELVLIEDASTDVEVHEQLRQHDGNPRVRVLRNERNLGFTATVNKVIRETVGDVVLLSSDTRVPPRWLQNLTVAAYSDRRVASATPLSDNAGAFAAPVMGRQNHVPEHLTDDVVGRVVAANARRLYPETPTGNGFCMYIRREAIDDIGLFDQDAFPRGYGEENDWSMRARRRGWRHVVDDATYVLHDRTSSFGDEKSPLADAGRAIVNGRFPEYTELIRNFVRSADMDAARQAVQQAFQADDTRASLPRTMFVIHHGRGGTVQTNADLVSGLPHDRECFILSSDTKTVRFFRVRPEGRETLDEITLTDPLRFDQDRHTEYRRFVASLLLEYGIELIHVRHLVKHTLDIPDLARQLQIPYVVSFHDYYMACPTVHLLDDHNRFCGGVCTAGDGDCRIPMRWIKEGAPHLKHTGVHEWRERLRPHLEHAAALVTTSASAREIYLRAYPNLDPAKLHVIEHGRDIPQTHLAEPPRDDTPVRILIPGNLDVHKGEHFIEELARHDAGRRLEFHFLGKVPEKVADHGVVHGTYSREEFADRIAEIGPSFVGLFSIWAETYSHALSEAWGAGVPVLASHLGALGERIQEHGGGWIIDIEDVRKSYEQILQISSDPVEYRRQQDRASVAALKSIRSMVADFERLYRTVVMEAASLDNEARQPLDVALLLVGGEGPTHPGTVHVRTLCRTRHPDVLPQVHADAVNPLSFIDNATPRPDLVFVQRTALDPSHLPLMLARCDSENIPLVFEIDDNLISPEHLPPDQPKWDDHVWTLRELARQADLVTVSTNALREVVAGLNPHVEAVANQLDERLWFRPVEAEDEPPDEVARILYMGTVTHASDLELLRPAMAQVEHRLGREVVLEVIGGEVPGPGQDWYSRLRVPRGRGPYPTFVRWLRSQRKRWSIAVAPLQDTPFTRYKSDLKFLEYAALGLPGVFSAVPAYQDTVTHGVTGLLTTNDADAWCSNIVELLQDPVRSRRLAQAATEYVRRERTIGHSAGDYVELLRRVARSGRSARRSSDSPQPPRLPHEQPVALRPLSAGSRE